MNEKFCQEKHVKPKIPQEFQCKFIIEEHRRPKFSKHECENTFLATRFQYTAALGIGFGLHSLCSSSDFHFILKCIE